jgi:hypothetical protein
MCDKLPRYTTILTDVGFLIGVVTALLYVCETVYINAYLSEWGLDQTLLGSTFHQTLYDGFVLLLFPILKGVTYLFIAIVLGSIITIVILNFSKTSYKYKRCVVKVRKKFPQNQISPLEKKLALWIGISSVAFVLLVVLIFSLSYFDKQGVRDAKALVASFKENKLDQKKIMRISVSKNKEINVFIIYCGSVMCSAIDIDNNELVIFNKQEQRFKRMQNIKI